MTNKKEVAQAVMKAYEAEDTYNFPKDGVVAAIREVVNQLGYTHLYVDGDHGLGVVNIRDILELCDELENL